MHLKSIDIVGYKSFAAKTHLDLGLGITGVVGPNGCGKSNIMESVRWCLGEMSWKSLRADSMVDVIFAGTAKRSPLSMAEVTLTFDNSQNTLPVQFSEVTVSRRLFRSGESAYFLNKTQCRLRDIRELFMDTGLGGGGYAIIDQGGVDFILNSNVEDRRAIFEEAAGVSKYKAKREEALRKLERVDADISRLRDSAALIDEQVKKLDADARKAKLYQKYKDELAAAEAAEILGRIAEADAELEQFSSQRWPLEEDLGRARAQSDGEGARLAALNLEKAGAQNDVIAVNRRIAETKAELDKIETRASFASAEITDADRRLEADASEKSVLISRLDGLGPEIGRIQGEAESARAQAALTQAEFEREDGRLNDLDLRRQEAERQMEPLKAGVLTASQAVLDVKREFARLESDFSNQEFSLRQALRDLGKDSARALDLERDLASARAAAQESAAALESRRGQSLKAEEELRGVRERLRLAMEQTARLSAELSRKRARLEAAEALGRKNPYWVGAQTILSAAIPGVVGMVGDIIKARDEFKECLEDALGERLYAVVCEDVQAARACVDFLRSSGRGRGRFLILSTVPAALGSARERPSQGAPILERLSFDPRHEAIARFLLAESYALDQTLFADHWVCGGAPSAEEERGGLAGIGDLGTAIAEMDAQAGRLSAEKDALESEAAAKESALEAARRETANAEAARHVLNAQAEDKNALLEAARQSVEIAFAEAVGGLARAADIKERIIAKRREIESAASLEERARSLEACAVKDAAAARENLAVGRAGLDAARARLKAAQDGAAFLERDLERLSREKSDVEDALAKRERERADLEAKKSKSAAMIEEFSARKSAISEDLSGLEISVQAKSTKLQEIEFAIGQREDAARGLRGRVDELQSSLHEIDVRGSSLRATRESLGRRLGENWGIGIEEAREKYAGAAAEPEKIEFLKKRVAGLGNVNMAAPEEYEALTGRQSYLSAQIDDLNKAKDDLRSAIQKINSATRENFRQTFLEVREHFRRLFSVLFEGGEADLILSDPENLLESGIDIMAQPPGKRLQNISLLSGGEKTLTAIALLFAFFLVKPSPFCMMDEADAALDDANVERFGQLLREFQSRTQFLIVSHNKRTMEAADVIYGVTMEEMGVSQLVSVDLRKRSAARPETLASASGS
ncbi:MAG: chromosome segregation protein SMC [Elusimicrobiota bacterium]